MRRRPRSTLRPCTGGDTASSLRSQRNQFAFFVTGEPGIGKTTLVEGFLQQVAADGSLWIGRGQCVEHYGAGEPYLPVLDALGRLCRGPRGERLVELLDRYAPTWLVQMPALLSAAELEVLQRKIAGATRGRMLRELAEAVGVITGERPLVLRLEDLHWSDYSTLEWLAFLARRQEPGRLLVLGTYRPVEVIVREHPLKTVKQELQVHGQCKELPLGLLSETVQLLGYPDQARNRATKRSPWPRNCLTPTVWRWLRTLLRGSISSAERASDTRAGRSSDCPLY